jgi:O-antigen biosynthesis alpha-1,3-rhamnosyltransferase
VPTCGTGAAPARAKLRPVIALEVSSGAGRPPHGGIASHLRAQVEALLRLDAETPYALCHRLSRWRKGDLFRPAGGNVRHRIVQDPFNDLLVPRARLFHSMSSYLPLTPRTLRLASIYDLTHLRHPEWVSPKRLERRQAQIRALVRRADGIVASTAFGADEARAMFGLAPERVHFVYAGVDSDAFRPLPAREFEPFRARYGDYVLAIGIITARKNFDVLARAVARLDGVKLVLVGRRQYGGESFFAEVERLGLRERFVHLEDLGHEDLVRLINAARVFAVPSLYEGFGLIVLEAMACGVPVVHSSASCLPEVAGGAGLSVDANDDEAVAEALRRALEDRELAAKLRSAGLARARELSWQSSARALRALYRELAGI